MDLRKSKRYAALDEMMPVIREKLDAGGEVRLLASGRSMMPLFRDGKDTVILAAADKKRLKKYDMILYRRDNGQYVLHRIVGRSGGRDGAAVCYTLRGDAQYAAEPGVREDQVIARAARFTRGGREYSCEHPVFRLYSVLWVNTCSARRIASAAAGKLTAGGRQAGRLLSHDRFFRDDSSVFIHGAPQEPDRDCAQEPVQQREHLFHICPAARVPRDPSEKERD